MDSAMSIVGNGRKATAISSNRFSRMSVLLTYSSRRRNALDAPPQVVEVRGGDLQVEHEQRDGDREHAVAELLGSPVGQRDVMATRSARGRGGSRCEWPNTCRHGKETSQRPHRSTEPNPRARRNAISPQLSPLGNSG